MDIPGVILRAARTALGLGQDDVAVAAGISRATVNKIEQDDDTVSNGNIRKVRKVLENRGIEFLYPTETKGPGLRLPKSVL